MMCSPCSVPVLSSSHPSFAMAVAARSSSAFSIGDSGFRFKRYDSGVKNNFVSSMRMKRWRSLGSSSATSDSAYPIITNQLNNDSLGLNICQEAIKAARNKFNQEISISQEVDMCLAKALLYIAAEDEAFMAFSREMDAQYLSRERRAGVSVPNKAPEWDTVEKMTLDGKNIDEWLSELDNVAKEVEAKLVSRNIGCCSMVTVLEAVNAVLFESRGFKRSSVLADSKHSYLHSVLNTGCGSAILISVIYIEVCQRLGLTVVGSCVGEDFVIWPLTTNLEELFEETSGKSLFAIANGSCVEDPKSLASELTSSSLSELNIAKKQDIIGIALANLIRLHWKRASRSNPGLLLTSPLREVHTTDKVDNPNAPLVRPQYLRLAIMASERSLILQPDNWQLRRDLGMLLYFNRELGGAVQELSICMAFAPEEEVKILEPFVEKLHLMRLESSWKPYNMLVP